MYYMYALYVFFFSILLCFCVEVQHPLEAAPHWITVKDSAIYS